MRGRSILLLGLLVVTGDALGQQQRPERIRIGWYGGDRPELVKYEGGGALAQTGQYYVAAPDQRTSWATYDLTIVYGREAFPLRAIVRDGREAVSLQVRRPRYDGCNRSDVNSIWSDRRSTIDERVARMIRARHLLVGEQCPKPERWKLAKRYFDTSCSLAQDARSGLDLSPEAQQFYREAAVADRHRQEAGTCTAVAQQRAILDLQSRMQRTSDLAGFRRLADELIGHAEDAAWEGAFAALKMDAETFRRRMVHEIYDRQNSARRVQTALDLNSELLGLLESNEYRAALGAEGITWRKLCGDRALILSRSPSTADTSDQCTGFA